MRLGTAYTCAIMPLDLNEFQTRVVVRSLRGQDFDALKALQLMCFPGMESWTREQFTSQVSRFPEGQICVELDGTLVASSASLIVDYSDYSDWHDFLRVSDGGFVRNHNPDGDTLYGIEIMVHPEARGLRLARRLYEARKELCRRLNLVRMVVGGRIPGYSQHKNAMTAQEYVRKVLSRDLVDSVLTAQLANGFQLRELIPDYLPSDEDSAGWATHMEWPNLDHQHKESHRTRRAYEPIRVSLVQYPMRPIASFEEFERQCEFFVDVASDKGSDFVCFPELFTLQLLSTVDAGRRPGESARALADLTPRYLALFTQMAVRHNINIVGGSNFEFSEGALYNAAYLFRRDGTLDAQEKIHPTPNERRWWGVQGGRKIRVLDTDRGKIAIAVCYDIEFPEFARITTAHGANILFVPFNTNDREGYLRVRYCAQARAVENQIYVVLSGCVGALPQVDNADIHYAQSAVFTPSDIPFSRDGIAVEASPNIETVLTVDVDIEALRKARRAGTVLNLADRRHDLYRVVEIQKP